MRYPVAGTSAYVGSIANISNSTLQTWAASILASNARTAAYTASVNGNQPFNGPFETPLSPQEVTTLSSPYVVSCPPNSTNIYQPGRNLTIAQSGNDAQFIFDNSSAGGQPLFAVFHQGLRQTFVPIDNGVAPIPANSSGIIFAEVTNSSTIADQNTIVAGPSFLNIPVANGTNGTVPATGPFTTIATSAATMTPTASASSSVAPTSEQSTSVETTTSTQESTVVVTATSSQESPQQSTVVVTATSSPEGTVVVTATASV
ncbi:hypothetical protein C0992_012422 [Termitomyces sp. T32_za158]|nr:hypothetical protein C0992_012422 [Termitomyces sp. T32_za158]